MKARDVQKIIGSVHDTLRQSVDHLAGRFADAAGTLEAEHEPLAEFSAAWSKLSKGARKLFVQELMKSAALVVAGSLATKAGLKLAGKSQKELRSVVITIAGLIAPAVAPSVRKVKKKAKRGKKKKVSV